MTIESLKSAGMTYQGSASAADPKQVAETPVVTSPTPSTSAGETLTIRENDAIGFGQNEEVANHEQIKRAVENINKNNAHTEAVFGIHEGTNRVTIKIIDKESRKVVKEFPPEKTLDMIEKVWEMAGLMVDEKR